MSDEYCTPLYIIEAAREVMGGIDLDPASSDARTAPIHITKEMDGLVCDWPRCESVWLNPPYSNTGEWVARLIAMRDVAWLSAILLVNNQTDAVWFHRALGRCDAFCLWRGRISFLLDGVEKKGNRQGQALFYFGDRPHRFCDVFAKFGWVTTV